MLWNLTVFPSKDQIINDALKNIISLNTRKIQPYTKNIFQQKVYFLLSYSEILKSKTRSSKVFILMLLGSTASIRSGIE